MGIILGVEILKCPYILGQDFQVINMHQIRSPNTSLESFQNTNVKSKHAFHLELWAKSYCQKEGKKSS
jgi:hypothetical protein